MAYTPSRLEGADEEIGSRYGLTTLCRLHLFATESLHEGSIPSLTALNTVLYTQSQRGVR